jgi:hypothetical protein
MPYSLPGRRITRRETSIHLALPLGLGGDLISARALQPREIYPRIDLRVNAGRSVSRKRMIPTQENEPILLGGTQENSGGAVANAYGE